MPIRVAIVEDSQRYRESLVALLGGAPGFQCVCVCSSAEEALRDLTAASPEVALMDLRLPGKSGGDCIRQLRAKHPALQFLVLTNFDDDDLIFGALQAGATGYITKRTPFARILEAIVEVHQGGSPMTPHIARRVLESFHASVLSGPPAEALTPREEEVLRLAEKARNYRDIAAALGISYDTVRTHFNHIYQKLHVHSRAEALMKFKQTGKLSTRHS